MLTATNCCRCAGKSHYTKKVGKNYGEELNGQQDDSVVEITRLLDQSGFQKNCPRVTLSAPDKFSVEGNMHKKMIK